MAQGSIDSVVVYDMDSTLWPLEQRVANGIGVDLNMLTTYRYMDNPNLTKSKRRKALEVIADPATFRTIDFHPGIEEISALDELGVPVHVQTNSMNAEINQLKLEQLLKAVPNLREENIHMDIVGVGDRAKCFDRYERVLVLADDSPITVSVSPAMINVMMRLPWNTTRQAIESTLMREVVWKDSLIDINRYIWKFIAKMQKREGPDLCQP